MVLLEGPTTNEHPLHPKKKKSRDERRQRIPGKEEKVIGVSIRTSSEDVYSDVLELLKCDSGGVNVRILLGISSIFYSEHAFKLICPKATLENT